MTDTAESNKPRPGMAPRFEALSRAPWWLFIILIFGVAMMYSIINLQHWQKAFMFIKTGFRLTIIISLTSFAIALVLGLIAGLGQLTSNLVVRNISLLYVQVIRGIPIIVQLYVVAFVFAPAFIALLNNLGETILSAGVLVTLGQTLSSFHIRDVDMLYRGIIGLGISYGAFEAEVFRAGIQSIERGQMEAARSLGMTHYQAMRNIILPQAIRVIMPPLGNDFISMLKVSSLASILAIRELTHMSQLHRARSFRSWESLGIAALLYLVMTLSLSALVNLLERRMSYER